MVLGMVARTMKDGALSMAVKAWVNEKFADYGRVTECVFDSESNRITVEAELRGEHEPITATIEQYEIEKERDGTAFIRLRRFDSSREWLTLLLTKLFAGKRYPVPPFLSKLL